MNRPALTFWIGLAVVLLAVGYLTGGRRNDGPPLDPDSTGPFGTRALTELLAEYDTDVRVGFLDQRQLLEAGSDSDGTTVFVLVDRLSTDQAANLGAWVRAGGRLVVADQGSSFSPDLAGVDSSDRVEAGSCDLDLEAQELEAGGFGQFGVADHERSCFGRGGHAHVVARSLGDGVVISLGGPGVLTNANLDEADNSVLAVELLAGDELVIVYDATIVPSDRTLLDLIPRGVRWLGWQLLLAFALFVWWQARRFGRVVAEPQAVEMPASLLVRAAAELARRSHGYVAAGERLRHDLDRRVRAAYRLPPDLVPGLVAEQVAAASGLELAKVQRALIGSPTETAAALVALTADVDAVTTQLDALSSPIKISDPAVGAKQ